MARVIRTDCRVLRFLVARIIAMVDAFDTMTHERSYRRPSRLATRWPNCAKCRQQFDPEVVDVFARLPA